jgi:hypothetical protein
MVRTQIQLTLAQHRLLKRRAKELGISLAEVIRRCVDEGLASEEVVPRERRVAEALAVCGKHADPAGPSRVAREHDAALAAAYRK